MQSARALAGWRNVFVLFLFCFFFVPFGPCWSLCTVTFGPLFSLGPISFFFFFPSSFLALGLSVSLPVDASSYSGIGGGCDVARARVRGEDGDDGRTACSRVSGDGTDYSSVKQGGCTHCHARPREAEGQGLLCRGYWSLFRR